jgi:hypothetical protein
LGGEYGLELGVMVGNNLGLALLPLYLQVGQALRLRVGQAGIAAAGGAHFAPALIAKGIQLGLACVIHGPKTLRQLGRECQLLG